MGRTTGPSARLGAADAPSATRLDLRGLHCPMPVLRAGKALRGMPIGGTLVLECTDPLSAIDVPHFVTTAGHDLIRTERNDTLLVFHIVKQR